jgi:hypothetical protein
MADEKHFSLTEDYTVKIAPEVVDGRKVRGWAVYQGRNLYDPYVASGWTTGPYSQTLKKAKAEALEGLNTYLRLTGSK